MICRYCKRALTAQNNPSISLPKKLDRDAKVKVLRCFFPDDAEVMQILSTAHTNYQILFCAGHIPLAERKTSWKAGLFVFDRENDPWKNEPLWTRQRPTKKSNPLLVVTSVEKEFASLNSLSSSSTSSPSFPAFRHQQPQSICSADLPLSCFGLGEMVDSKLLEK
jgi:hypothetical protein